MMMEALKTKRHLRLTDNFVFYDPDHGFHLFRSWRRGTVVTDPDEINFLEARGAPVDRVEGPKP